jgi:polyferredoxin
VHVCPTGIDIRNGTQLECVNCTACIDACDEVMVKIGKPKGLIRFASYNSIKEGVKKLFTARVAGYSAVLIALVVLLSFMVATRSDIETTILKVPGTLFQRTDDGKITNLYNIEFVNKTFTDIELTLKAESPTGVSIRKVGDQGIVVPAGDLYKGVWFIEIPADKVTSAKMLVRIGVYKGEKKIETVKAKFVGPVHSHRDRVKGNR